MIPALTAQLQQGPVGGTETLLHFPLLQHCPPVKGTCKIAIALCSDHFLYTEVVLSAKRDVLFIPEENWLKVLLFQITYLDVS